MTQSLIKLPQTADIEIDGWHTTYTLKIRDYKVADGDSLFNSIMCIVNNMDPDTMNQNRLILSEFEKHGISFEAAIEYCAKELGENPDILRYLIVWEYFKPDLKHIVRFAESDAGRIIAEQFVEKIRSCDDWGQLYDEMQRTSKFQQDIKSRIHKELEQCRKV